jgi:heme/copper-type cytochrome/quinol oxidase subunit 2
MDHGFMPIVVRVASQEEYEAWLGERQQVSSLAAP